MLSLFHFVSASRPRDFYHPESLTTLSCSTLALDNEALSDIWNPKKHLKLRQQVPWRSASLFGMLFSAPKERLEHWISKTTHFSTVTINSELVVLSVVFANAWTLLSSLHPDRGQALKWWTARTSKRLARQDHCQQETRKFCWYLLISFYWTNFVMKER